MSRGRHARPVLRRATARLAAAAVGATALTAGLAGLAAPASAATPISPETGKRAVALAAQEAGDRYVFGDEGPDTFDCSGLVQYVYGRLGISVPRTSSEQYAATLRVPRSDLRLGDIIFFHDANGRIYHDAIYAGLGRMWAAPRTGEVVRLQNVYGSAWSVGRIATGVRPTAVPAAPAVLKVGSRGPAVVEVQRALRIPADGVFGSGTAAAVKRFQVSRRLVADGVVGLQTKQALLAGGTSTSVAQPVSGTTARPVLRQGDRGPAVVTLQRGLRIAVDGAFGPATKAAVVGLQKRSRLVADGIVGAKTWAVLGARTA